MNDSFCRAEAIYQDFCWHRSRCVRKGIEGPAKKHFTNATGDMKLTMYLRRPTASHTCKMYACASVHVTDSKLFRALCFFLSFSFSHFLSLYAGRPRSGSMVATGGCTGMSCQRHHLHRFVPFVLK